MLEMDKPISSQQLSFMTFILLIGSALVYVTGQAARQDAWLACLLGLLPGLYILYAVLKLHNMFPGHRISEISTLVLGRFLGTILNILFFWAAFIFTITLLYDILILLKITYPAIPRTILFPVILLPCIYCLYLGLTVLGRLGELFIWGSLFFAIAGFFIALPLVNLSNLTPVFEAWKPLLAGAIYTADWPFDEVVVWGLFLPLVSDLKQNKKYIYYWYLLGGLVLVMLNLEAIATFGPELTQLFSFPLFEVFRVAGFGEFRRVDVVFLVFWFITDITAVIIFYQGILFLLQDTFRLKGYKPLILPLGLFLMVFALYMIPSDLQYRILDIKYSMFYTFPINLLYPTIILLAAKLRGLPR